MCRNIRPLNNFEPPATRDEVTAAALQYVRKVAGATRPSARNEEAFERAVGAGAAALRFGSVRTCVAYRVSPVKARPPTRLPSTVGISFQIR